MGKTPAKGVDALIQAQRPVLRAVIYATIALMSILQLALTGVSWTSIEFMRRSGDFIGALSVISGIFTFCISSIYAVATILTERAENDHEQVPLFCERFNRPSVERLINCMMASWWFAMSTSNSNMLFVFRDDISKCVRGEDKNSSPDACKIMRGAVTLNWLILLLWIIRAWRGFTRGNIHFDSRIFAEALDDHELLTYPSPIPDASAHQQQPKQPPLSGSPVKKSSNTSMGFEVVGSLPPLPQRFLRSSLAGQTAHPQQAATKEPDPVSALLQNPNGQTQAHKSAAPHTTAAAIQPPHTPQLRNHENLTLVRDVASHTLQQQQQSPTHPPTLTQRITQPAPARTAIASINPQNMAKALPVFPGGASPQQQEPPGLHAINITHAPDCSPAFETNGTSKTVGTIHPQFQSTPATGVSRQPRYPAPPRAAPQSSVLQPAFPTHGQGPPSHTREA
ncbi:hypothetical protein EC988_001599 [Linderina pennispora]|nr:hypothetical protein EC988_001599 [Linderina pennispora]